MYERTTSKVRSQDQDLPNASEIRWRRNRQGIGLLFGGVVGGLASLKTIECQPDSLNTKMSRFRLVTMIAGPLVLGMLAGTYIADNLPE